MKTSKSSVLRHSMTALHVVAGIYAGACISIALVDMRYVLSISDPGMLQTVFAPLLQNMGILMVPQLMIILALCLFFSYRAVKLKRALKSHIPLVVYIAILAITVLVHIPINTDVLSSSLSGDELISAARKWDQWHWIRTALSVALPVAVMKFYRVLAVAR